MHLEVFRHFYSMAEGKRGWKTLETGVSKKLTLNVHINLDPLKKDAASSSDVSSSSWGILGTMFEVCASQVRCFCPVWTCAFWAEVLGASAWKNTRNWQQYSISWHGRAQSGRCCRFELTHILGIEVPCIIRESSLAVVEVGQIQCCKCRERDTISNASMASSCSLHRQPYHASPHI